MSVATKNRDVSSKSNIDLGTARKKRIKRFRSAEDPDGTRFKNLDDAVNTLLDRQLDAERV